MKEQIIQLFKKHASGNQLIFSPEIKIRRERDILFLYEIHASHFTNASPNYHVILERGTTEKTKIPLGMLDDLSLKAICDRLKTLRIVEERIR